MRNPVVPILASAALSALLTTPALATSTWSFACGGGGQPACVSTSSSSTSGVSSSYNYSASGTSITARVSGWGATGADGDTGAGKRLQAGRVGSYSGGLGITSVGESTSSPDHAIDNGGPDEYLLVTFSQAVQLSGVNLGWISGDGDLTILAYTGAGAPNLTQNTLSSADASGGTSVGLINSGWSLVAHSSSDGTNTKNHSFNTGGTPVQSSYWLIGAYNSNVATPRNGLTVNDDYFKLLSVAGTVASTPTGNPVPVPGTLALVALALPWMRRRLSAR